MYTLFIDTHFKDILVCIFKDNDLVSKSVISDFKSTSVHTMPLIVETLEKCNINIKDINKVAVCKGPGSFTGVRIGVSIAKTLSYSLNIPIVSLTSIDLIGINLDKVSYVSVLENNGAFVSLYDGNSNIEYMKKSVYEDFKSNNNVVENIDMDYLKLINFINTLPEENCHNVNPLYIKNIEVLNDKKN